MESARVERYYAREARIYDATRWAFLLDRSLAIDRLEAGPDVRVLDVACGTGLNIGPLLRRGVRRLEGVDLSEAMLARARRKFPDVAFHRLDITHTPLPGPFDRILCTYGLSMIEDVSGAVRTMARSLSNGGRLVALDFHPLRAPWNALEPLWRRWLLRHGVDPHRPIAASLERSFTDVRAEVRHGGYDAIYVATGPRPN